MSNNPYQGSPYNDIYTDRGVIPRDKGYGKKIRCSWFVSPGLAIFYLCFVLGLWLLATTMLYIGRAWSGAIFFLISLPFLWYIFIYGSTLTIDDDGVHLSFLGRRRQAIRWEDVAQLGIAGKKVFNGRNPKKTGSLYIYFSQKELSDDDCFQMMLKWPQAGVVFVQFSHDHLRRIQAFYSGTVKRYNTGKLFFG